MLTYIYKLRGGIEAEEGKTTKQMSEKQTYTRKYMLKERYNQ